MEKALNKQLQMETNVALGCLNQSFLSPLPPTPSFIPASPRPHFEQFYGIQMDSVARNGQKTKPKGKALRYRFMQIAAESIQYPARPDMQQTVDCRNFTEPHEGVGEGGGRGGEFGGACALQK